MSTEAGMGAAQGAMQGATAGAALGPVGMIVGGVIGGLGGYLSGNAASQARKHMSKANKADYQIRVRQAAIQRRDLLRNFRAQRAMQIAASFTESGGTMSSTAQGAMGSLQSQYGGNLNMFDWSAGAQKYLGKHMMKAGKYENRSGLIQSATNALLNVGSAYAGWQAAENAAGEQAASTANTFIKTHVNTSGVPVSNMPQYEAPAGGYVVRG